MSAEGTRRMIGVFIGEVDGVPTNVDLAVLINGDRVLLLINGTVVIEGSGPAVARANHHVLDRMLDIPILAEPTVQHQRERVNPCLVVQSDPFQFVE